MKSVLGPHLVEDGAEGARADATLPSPSADTAIKAHEYDYLLKTPLWNLTSDAVEALGAELGGHRVQSVGILSEGLLYKCLSY